MHRHALSDAQWTRLQKVLPKHRRGPKSRLGDRQFVDAVLYRAKTGLPWRDLPERFGPWKTVYNRFTNWAARDHWAAISRRFFKQAARGRRHQVAADLHRADCRPAT
jgi:transposase